MATDYFGYGYGSCYGYGACYGYGSRSVYMVTATLRNYGFRLGTFCEPVVDMSLGGAHPGSRLRRRRVNVHVETGSDLCSCHSGTGEWL